MESTATQAAKQEVSFELDASEEKLLEEFGTLMSVEYNYMTT